MGVGQAQPKATAAQRPAPGGFMCPPGAEVGAAAVAVFQAAVAAVGVAVVDAVVVVAVVAVLVALEAVLEAVGFGCWRLTPGSSSTKGAVSKPGISARWYQRGPPRTWADLPRHPTTGHTSTDPAPQP